MTQQCKILISHAQPFHPTFPFLFLPPFSGTQLPCRSEGRRRGRHFSFFLFYLWTIFNPKKSNKSHAPRSEVGKRKNQKSRKGPDKKKKVPDIAKIFFGKEAAAAAAATKTTGEKSTKISVPVKKKSVKSKMGQSSANESSPQPSSSGLQPITSTPNPPMEDAAPYRTGEKIFTGVKTKSVVYDRCLLFRCTLDPGVKNYNPILEVTN